MATAVQYGLIAAAMGLMGVATMPIIVDAGYKVLGIERVSVETKPKGLCVAYGSAGKRMLYVFV